MIWSWNNNNKRLRWMYYTAETTDRHKASRGLSATAELLVIYCTQTECSCTPCPKKYTPWLLTVSCCNLSAILLINPLNTVRLSTQSSTIIRIVVIVRLRRRIIILVVSASYRRLHKNSLKVRLLLSPCLFPYSSRFLIHVCTAACQLK